MSVVGWGGENSVMISRFDDMQSSNTALLRRCEAAEGKAVHLEAENTALRAQLVHLKSAVDAAQDRAKVSPAYTAETLAIPVRM